MLRRLLLAAACASIALATLPVAPAAAQVAADARVVVADLDSGINPYHEAFQVADPSVTPAVLEELGIDAAHVLDLTRTGDFAADYAADAALWARVEPQELYWFEGTNIVATSFTPGSRILLPDDSGDTHGVGTAAAVLQANPEAILFFVEGNSDAAESYVMSHPAVDLVTTSYGPIGSPPLQPNLTASYEGVVGNGKLHFGAADNSPALSPIDATAGPWWSIGIAGYEEGDTEGRQVLSGSLPDFLGDFTQDLPYCHDCESGVEEGVAGTSFATPRSAGTMSAILLAARRAAGHTGGIVDVDGVPHMVAAGGVELTNWELRRALEEAAYYPAGGLGIDSTPINPVLPAAQAGWGAITPDPQHDVVGQALAHLGIGGTAPTRTKDATTCDTMTQFMEARFAYWTASPTSESFLETGYPYLPC